MRLSYEDLQWVRNQIGDATPPSDDDLGARFAVLGDRTAVVQEVLDRRLANLLADPSSFSVSGEYSQSTEANIRGIQAKLVDLGGSSGESGLRIVRPDYRRSR